MTVSICYRCGRCGQNPLCKVPAWDKDRKFRICESCISDLEQMKFKVEKEGYMYISNNTEFIFCRCSGCGHPIHAAADARQYNDKYFCPGCFELEKRKPFQQLNLFPEE